MQRYYRPITFPSGHAKVGMEYFTYSIHTYGDMLRRSIA